MDKEKFGSFVSCLRKEKGITQKELADQLHLTDKAVSKWERGLSFPDISMLEPLADVLDVTVLELLKGERIQKEQSFTMKEAERLVDHSISISDEEIARVHEKNKLLIILFCVLVMLMASVTLNIINWAKENNTSKQIMQQRVESELHTEDEDGGAGNE